MGCELRCGYLGHSDAFWCVFCAFWGEMCRESCESHPPKAGDWAPGMRSALSTAYPIVRLSGEIIGKGGVGFWVVYVVGFAGVGCGGGRFGD